MVPWNTEELARQQQPLDDDAADLLPLFAAELARGVECFRHASLRHDLTAVTRLCHRMRGSASLYGYHKFAERLLKSEALILAGELDPALICGELAAVARGIWQASNQRLSPTGVGRYQKDANEVRV